VQVSDFASWEDFSKWTVDLFKVNKIKDKALTKFVDSLKSIPDVEKRVLTAIKTVQDKVRYLSFVDGLSAYRPHDPSQVFGNKYGDCKDKSLLLSEILNELGLESYPVLVNTDYGRVMDMRLPSAWNFDHCIVQFRYGDSTYYLDPTITWQRGTIKKIVTPDYYHGVVADVKQPGLTKIPVAKNWSVIRAKEDFEVLELGGRAKLKVETYYSGSEADNVREGFKTKTKSETNKDYVNFYANEYPEIKLTKSVWYSDDTVNNAITVFEEYEIPKFWTYDSSRNKYVAETYARVVSSYLERPTTKARNNPFTIRYPLDAQLVTNVHLPEPWEIQSRLTNLSGA
jgi:transglutaminase-like putative cysteine protease